MVNRFYTACMYYRAGICPPLGTDAFQETDVINVTMPVTMNYQVTDATEIPSVLAKAFYIAQRPSRARIDRYYQERADTAIRVSGLSEM